MFQKKKNLNLVIYENGTVVEDIQLEDPFHVTRILHSVKFDFWDRVKFLFTGTYEVGFIVKLMGNHTAHRQWFSNEKKEKYESSGPICPSNEA